MPCAMFGDEWAAEHFTNSGPYLARNLILASEHNPWLRKKLEEASTGQDAMMMMISLVGVAGALFAYAVPPVIWWFNLPAPRKTREMFGIPDRREPTPPPPYAADQPPSGADAPRTPRRPSSLRPPQAAARAPPGAAPPGRLRRARPRAHPLRLRAPAVRPLGPLPFVLPLDTGRAPDDRGTDWKRQDRAQPPAVALPRLCSGSGHKAARPRALRAFSGRGLSAGASL